MAKIDKEGFISGKIGGEVYFKRNGQRYVRESPKKRGAGKTTQAQSKNQNLFGVASHEMKRLSRAFAIGFAKIARPGQSAYSAGISHNMQHAMVDTEQGWQVDWSQVMMSCGSLPCADNVRLTLKDDGEFYVLWDQNLTGKSRKDDVACVVMLDHDSEVEVSIATEATREDMGCKLPISAVNKSHRISVYLFFKRASNTMVSDSCYVGDTNVEE